MKSVYMRRRGIVIIGTGRIAAVHALSVRRNPALELTGFVNEFEAGDLPGPGQDATTQGRSEIWQKSCQTFP